MTSSRSSCTDDRLTVTAASVSPAARRRAASRQASWIVNRVISPIRPISSAATTKDGRIDGRSARTVPAKQCLVSDDRSVGQRPQRLEVEAQQPFGDHMAHEAVRVEPPRQRVGDSLLEGDVAIATVGLRVEHRRVGATHQIVDGLHPLVPPRDADAGGHRDGRAVELDRHGDGLEQASAPATRVPAFQRWGSAPRTGRSPVARRCRHRERRGGCDRRSSRAPGHRPRDPACR